MKIIDIHFTGTSAEVSDLKLLIRPELFLEIDTTDVTVALEYGIITPGVNLAIVDPDKDKFMSGTNATFRKDVRFVKRVSGTKKDFKITVTAKLGNSTRVTLPLNIRYR
jgi:hypothetical protein